MKIVLIIPPSPWLISDTDLPFLGILYISSYLKKFGHESQVCDLSGVKEEDWKIPIGDLYGVTGTSPHFIYIKKIIDVIKQREPNKKVIVGGAHATILPEHLLQNTLADICVIGEGEQTMLELLNETPIKSINGIVYKNKEEVLYTPPRNVIKDLDQLPYPDLDSIDFYKYGKSQIFKYLIGDCLEATVMSARGCPYHCSFCASYTIHKGKCRQHSVERVSEEIKMLVRKYGVKLIYFLDDTFVVNKKRVIGICDAMKEMNLSWHCLNRVDHCDYEILKIMKDSGCLQLVIGFESGSNDILKIVNKKTTIEQAYKAIDVIKSVGMKIRGQMIVGLPGETDKTVEETAEFIRKAKDVDAFGLHIFQPYPGCDIWENPDAYGYQIEKDTDFSSFHTIGKPNVKITKNPKVDQWFNYLKGVIDERSIELK